MIKVGIIGTSGYTGSELLRLLHNHPQVEINYIASHSHAGRPIKEVMPAYAHTHWIFEPVDMEAMTERCDCIITAAPQGVAMELAEVALAKGRKLIDIGTDFRFKDAAVYKSWYGLDHTHPELLEQAVYGLPELFREQIKGAHLIGNPGCYPTSVLLGLAPLLKADLIDEGDVIINSMSGVSGAGRKPGQLYHFPERTENLMAYGVTNHRHTPEIALQAAAWAGKEVRVSFTPHLVPMSRGILSNINTKLKVDIDPQQVQKLYEDFYAGEEFVHVLPELPQTKAVQGTNYAHMAVRVDKLQGRVITLVAIDNLGKGAAGQAIQNLNLIFGLDEGLGLRAPALYP
ncbi:MAG: N-acetyl-gamma-glutamyl-phosphate reductase [Limnochordia bacterium]